MEHLTEHLKEHAGTGGIRINKYLSELGLCSRREADRLLEEGRVRINGHPAEKGSRVLPGDLIEADGQAVMPGHAARPVVIAFHKPGGIVCTSSDKDRAVNIIDYIGYPDRIYPVGRLDKESTGLILLTNRGELAERISKAGNGHEKEYRVRCRDRVSDVFLKKLAGGVEIRVPVSTGAAGRDSRAYRTVTTKKCRVTRVDDSSFMIILTQGMNRQIRRMCAALGNPVEDLCRVRILNIMLGDLPEGKYRELEGQELAALEAQLGLRADAIGHSGKSNRPVRTSC